MEAVEKKLTEEEKYYQEREKIISLFNDEEFVKNYVMQDAVFKQVFESLIRGTSPYDIIKVLIERQKDLIDKIAEIMRYMPPLPVKIG